MRPLGAALSAKQEQGKWGEVFQTPTNSGDALSETKYDVMGDNHISYFFDHFTLTQQWLNEIDLSLTFSLKYRNI